MNIPDHFARVTPYLFAENAADYMDHLIAALDGADGGRNMRDDTLANGIVRFDGASVMISEAGRGFPPSQVTLYLYVENADDAMTRAVDRGMEKITDVADMDYGDRQGGVKDKAGNIWWLSQRLEDKPYY